MLRLGDLADPAVAAEVRAQLEEQARPAPCIGDYSEFLKLSGISPEERTPEQQARFEELAPTYNPPASAEEIDDAQERRDQGEHVGLDDAIVLDAAYRATIPRNRTDRRFQRRAPKLSVRVLLRPILTAAGRFRDRGDSSRPRGRRAAGSARARAPGRPSRQDDDPPELAPFDPLPRDLYAAAAAFDGDRRVAEWLEAWGDEALEEQAA